MYEKYGKNMLSLSELNLFQRQFAFFMYH